MWLDVEEALSLNSLDHQALFSFQEHGYCETGGLLEKAVFFLSTVTVFVRGDVFSLIERC